MRPSIIIYNKDSISDKFRNSFESLIEKVDDLTSVSIIKPLTGGFSESVPLLVYAVYTNTATYQVFKIGKEKTIGVEAQNWKNFIKNGPYDYWNVVHLIGEPILMPPYGLIVYNLVGQITQNSITFKDFYMNIGNPEDTLRYLFKDVLKLSSDRTWKTRGHRKISEILDISKSNRDQIVQNVKKLSSSNICTVPKVKITGIELYNPLYFYPFRSSLKLENTPIPIPLGIVHGDLNARNILFYEIKALMKEGIKKNPETVEIPCIIDYARTGNKVLYADIAKLESVLKFHLLDARNLKLDELLQFEQEIILSSFNLNHTDAIHDPHLQKLFSCIKALRKLASEILQNDYNSLGYWLELYRNTLLYIKYEDILEWNKRYAFTSAALILTKHLVSEVTSK